MNVCESLQDHIFSPMPYQNIKFMQQAGYFYHVASNYWFSKTRYVLHI